MHETRAAQCVIILALAATLLRLARKLPWQNVIACSFLIALLSGIVQAIGARTGLPFGQFHYTDQLGHLLFRQVPWPMPLLWIVILLNARSVAQLILRPWRETSNYGLWVIGLASLLAALFDAALEPVASLANHWWTWNDTFSFWSSAPWINFIGWAITTFVILVLISPWLINKRMSRESPDYFPLLVWIFLTLLLAIENGVHHLWPATILMLATDFIVAVLIFRKSKTFSKASVAPKV